MKKIKLNNQVKLIAIKNFRGEDKLIDYYLVLPGEQEKIYAFSKIYTHTTYDLCKSGVRVNDLMIMKSRNSSVMRLVKYLKFMMPYFVEYYCIPVVA